MKLPHSPGDEFGWFQVPFEGQFLYIQACDEFEGWEHVSVSKENGVPWWKEMCFVKDLFWDDDDLVVQFHPAKKDYVNIAKNCLHLWRYCGEMPIPPKKMV
jgi:hypothetical protein